MFSRRRWLFPAVLGLVSVASCGLLLDYDALQKGSPDASAGGAAGSGAGGAGGSGIALSDLAPAVASALCDNLTACYGAALELFIHDEDCTSFFTHVLADQTVAPIQASIDRGVLTYDPLGGAACVAKITSATATTPATCLDLNAVIEDCKSMLGNTAGNDAPCNERYECGHALRCKLESCPGTCTTFGDVGATCATNDDCDPTKDLYCGAAAADVDAGTAGAGGAGSVRTCQKRISTGTACTDRQECVAGAFCIGGTCKPVTSAFTLEAGYDCWSNGILCKAGLSCEFSVPLVFAKCAAEKALAAQCRYSFPDECPKGSYCNATIGNLNGQCVASPGQNQPCAQDLEQNLGAIAAPCAAGLVCVNGLCKPYESISNPCEANEQCYSGACQAPASGGAAVCVVASCP